MAFTYVTLRFFHSGTIQFGPPPTYVGGIITDCLDRDIDTLSYFELKDYIKEFGYTSDSVVYVKSPFTGALIEIKSDVEIMVIVDELENGDTVEIFVQHPISVPVPNLLLEYRDSHADVEENETGVNGGTCEGVTGGDLNTEGVTGGDLNTEGVTGGDLNTEGVTGDIVSSDSDLEVLPSDVSTEDSSDSAHEELFEEGEGDYGSDVHEEYRQFREERRLVQISKKRDSEAVPDEEVPLEEVGPDPGYDENGNRIRRKKKKKSKRREKTVDDNEVPAEDVGPDPGYDEFGNRVYKRSKRRARAVDPNEVPLEEVGPDIGFDETAEGGDLTGKLGGDEPYYASSEAGSFETDDEDPDEPTRSHRRKKSNRVYFDPSAKVIMWQLGMVFESVVQFREAVTEYSIQRGIQVVKFVNEPGRVRVNCNTKGCPWLLYASIDTPTQDFVIKTYNPRHKCVKTTKNYLCNSKYLAKHYKDRIIGLQSMKIHEFQKLIRKELGFHVGKTTCRRARARMLKEVMGDHIEEFRRIYDYKDEILRTNPGSTCVIKVGDPLDNGQLVFQGFYVCFDAMKKAFLEGCRKCIGLDGCFLKGVCKGQILVAVCKDGNNQMLPIAWAVVEYENKRTWSWFLQILQHDLQLEDGTNITLISDMQKGLDLAVKQYLPEAEHRWCARHILANWSKRWRGQERRNAFWRCARSTFEAEAKVHMAALRKLGDHRITEDLLYYNKEKWCKVYFSTVNKSDMVDNNMAESFNAWILSARQNTIITMLEEIRVKVMKRIGQLREFSTKWPTAITPMAYNCLEKNIDRSMKCYIDFNGDAGYEIVEETKIGKFVHNVDMRNLTCSCRSWELKGIPCAHACCAMHHRKVNPMDYVSHWYSRETYLRTYSHFIQPMRNMKMWPESNNPVVAPPEVKRMPGRPKKLRRKEATETKKSGKLSRCGVVMTCSSCKEKGHNKRGCPKAPTGPSTSRAARPPSTSRKVPRPTSSAVASGSTPSTSAAPTSSTAATTGPPSASRQVPRANSSAPSSGPSSSAATRGLGRARTRPATGHYKRPRVVGVGVFQADNGFTAINPGLSGSRVLNHGSKTVIRSAEVTGNIGFQPSKGLKWQGKQAISSSKLQQMTGERRVQARMNTTQATAGNNPSQGSTTSIPQQPWKL